MLGAGQQAKVGRGPEVEPRHLDQLLSQIDWARGQSVELVDSWQSPNARLFRYRVEGAGRTVIVKAGSNWGPSDAERVHTELRRVHALLKPLGVEVPEPFGYINDPPLVAMDEVKGDSIIKKVLPARSYLNWPAGPEKLKELAGLCGMALARYHAAEPSPDTNQVEETVRADVRRAALRGLMPASKANDSLRGLRVARGFRFSANDFLTDGERLILLDPPHLIRHDLIHRDLSSFTFEVERTLRVLAKDWDYAETNEDIRSAFLQGYGRELATIAGWDWNPAGRGMWALAFYELSRIAGMAFNQAKAGRVRQAWSGFRWAWQKRRQLNSLGRSM
jgi:hypothetical protein